MVILMGKCSIEAIYIWPCQVEGVNQIVFKKLWNTQDYVAW